MDGLTLTFSAVELQSLVGGRIEKIRQPEKYELLFSVHTFGGTKNLIISSSTENCRLHITEAKPVSPVDAPNFLMLLRKHLTGARITAIEQPNLDRTVLIRFEALTELHDSTAFTLACEIMGKYSNIILVDSEGNIVDAIRRVSANMSSVRLVMPKLPYSMPPVQDKRCIRDLSSADVESILNSAITSPAKALSAAIFGLSPAVASMMIDHCESELVRELKPSADHNKALADKLLRLYGEILSGSSSACILKRGDKPMLLPFTPFGYEALSFPSLSKAADEFYRARSEEESIRRRTASLERVLSNCIQRAERKVDKFALSIGDEEEIERLRLFGELLTANLYLLPERGREAVVSNYYLDPPAPVHIPLDETYSAADNAQIYYKKYRKAKAAREYALSKREEAVSELEYLRGVYSDLSQCLTDSDFDEVRGELAAGGYVREDRKKKMKLPASKPHCFISSDGIEILVGKNNVQNDRLTFKTASPDDLWLHTKDIHGSHVIVRCGSADVPDRTLLEASKLAAYYSQARQSSAVPVDYARRKFVKKPSGSKPGMVIYSNNKTVFVTPDPALADSIRRKKQ